ncbi:hypothetical protein GCM10025734_57290 [Kitasatospora paranensis]
MPGQGEPPGEVVGVAQAVGEVLHAEGAVQVGGVSGEEAPSGAEAGGEALLGGVVGGGEQLVRGEFAAPAGEGGLDPGEQGVAGDDAGPGGVRVHRFGGGGPAGRQTPVQAPQAVRERAGAGLAVAAPRGFAVQPGLAREGQVDPDGGDRVPVHGGPAGEADLEQLADGGAGAVAADQVAAAPPGAGAVAGAGGAHAHPVAVLLQFDDLGERHQLDQRGGGDGVPQAALEAVLGEVQDGCAVQRDAQDLGPAAPDGEGVPGGGVGDGPVVAEPGQQGGGVLAEHHGARALGADSRALVEDDAGHLVPGEGEGEGQADRPGPDHDHRVHAGTSGRAGSAYAAWVVPGGVTNSNATDHPGCRQAATGVRRFAPRRLRASSHFASAVRARHSPM